MLRINRSAVDAILEQARQNHPRECCGILLGADGRVERLAPASNVHPEPDRFFEIDPQILIDSHRAAREGGPQVVGYYHSHPTGPAAPSATDIQMAAGDGMIWAIIGHGEVRFWRDSKSGFEPLSYTLIDG